MVCSVAGFPTCLSNRAVKDILNLRSWVLSIAVDVCVVRNVGSQGLIYIKGAQYFLMNLWCTCFCSQKNKRRKQLARHGQKQEFMQDPKGWTRQICSWNEISFDKLHFSSFIVVQRRINSASRQAWRYCLIYWCETEITSQRVIFLTHYWFDLGTNRSP